MIYKIKDATGKVCETHDSARQAARALIILNAHEFKNGRGRDYWHCEPSISEFGFTINGLNIPDWAREALGEPTGEI